MANAERLSEETDINPIVRAELHAVPAVEAKVVLSGAWHRIHWCHHGGRASQAPAGRTSNPSRRRWPATRSALSASASPDPVHPRSFRLSAVAEDMAIRHRIWSEY